MQEWLAKFKSDFFHLVHRNREQHYKIMLYCTLFSNIRHCQLVDSHRKGTSQKHESPTIAGYRVHLWPDQRRKG